MKREIIHRFGVVAVCVTFAIGGPLSSHAQDSRPFKVRQPATGMLFYAKSHYMQNTEAIKNPYIIGAFFQIYWSQFEKENGVYDWSLLDNAMKPWTDAGKKVVLRIFWSANGAWPDPINKTPTPKWVWDEGAKFCFDEPTQTEIPLMWDPIYKKYAFRFIDELAKRYDRNENVLLFDITPGGETSPYRFSMNRAGSGLQARFQAMEASDGTKYFDEMWFETCKEFIGYANKAFKTMPLLVTLNVGGFEQNNFVRLGEFCVSQGIWVGQNGLSARTGTTESDRAEAIKRWEKQVGLSYEMVASADSGGGRTGTLMQVMQAAERIGADYVNVYPEDVLKSIPGQPKYDPNSEAAMKYGVKVIGPKDLAEKLNLVNYVPPAEAMKVSTEGATSRSSRGARGPARTRPPERGGGASGAASRPVAAATVAK